MGYNCSKIKKATQEQCSRIITERKIKLVYTAWACLKAMNISKILKEISTQKKNHYKENNTLYYKLHFARRFLLTVLLCAGSDKVNRKVEYAEIPLASVPVTNCDKH